MDCSFSTAPFDGYPLEVAFEEIAAAGGTHAEPAFIQGYTDPFTEEIFTEGHAREIRTKLAAAGLGVFAVSCHMDLGVRDAADVFARRMTFVKEIGADLIVTNAAVVENRQGFMQTIRQLSRRGQELELTIALENPGDGRPNLLDSAKDALKLLEELKLPRVGLNYDPGNTVSHLPGRLNPVADGLIALPSAVFMLLKDVRRTPDGYFFTPLGEGDLDYAPLLAAMAAERSDLRFSVEIPARLHRGPDAQPVRAAEPVPLERIRPLLNSTIGYLRGHRPG
jgi:sugar phosphate isomerase/epimerase